MGVSGRRRRRVRCWGWGDAGRLGHANTKTIGDDETPASAGDVAVGAPVLRLSAGDSSGAEGRGADDCTVGDAERSVGAVVTAAPRLRGRVDHVRDRAWLPASRRRCRGPGTKPGRSRAADA